MYYIKKIRIRGYKGFKDTTIVFNKGKKVVAFVMVFSYTVIKNENHSQLNKNGVFS